MNGATLDTGALIAFEKGRRPMLALVARARAGGHRLAVPAGVVAQAWRNGARQVRLARLLASDVVDIIDLDDRTARAVGQLCGVTGTSDIVDASVVLCAQTRRTAVCTADPRDMHRIDPKLELIEV